MTRAGDTVEARLQRSLERENTVDADKTCGFSVPGKNTAVIRRRDVIRLGAWYRKASRLPLIALFAHCRGARARLGHFAA